MSKTVFELNKEGVRELLKSDKMKSVLEKYASVVKKRAGEGFECDIYSGKNRLNASVRAASKKAYWKNKKNNILLKALFS